uniref:Uncharacterized protein n=1 Tax=Arundo donax TaxID=35708 RepID=A0A0A9FXP5_ARUDO
MFFLKKHAVICKCVKS